MPTINCLRGHPFHSLRPVVRIVSIAGMALTLFWPGGLALAQLGEASRDSPSAEMVDGEYIVIFADGELGLGQGESNGASAAIQESESWQRKVKEAKGEILFIYRYALIGFSAKMRRDKAEELFNPLHGPDIEFNTVQQIPQAVRVLSLLPAPVASMPLGKMKSPQKEAPMGLARIDRRWGPGDERYQFRNIAEDVDVYVIDSGIYAENQDFEKRVTPGFDAFPKLSPAGCKRHGTAVASIIGGRTYGIAKGVTLHPVRVIPCGDRTTTAVTLKGVDWVFEDRVTRKSKRPAVVNMSLENLEDPEFSWLDVAIKNSIKWGKLTYVIAAGNRGKDACKVSPARVGKAITVGNISPRNDSYIKTSNYGRCVDIFAPGEDIIAAGVDYPTTPPVSFGMTSAAAPHVAGVAALFLQFKPNAEPKEVWAAIRKAANDSTTSGWCGISNRHIIPRDKPTKNVMLHWGAGSDDGLQDEPIDNAAPAQQCATGGKSD